MYENPGGHGLPCQRPCWRGPIFVYLVLAALFLKVPRPGESEVTFSVIKQVQVKKLNATCYYLSNHTKVEAIPLSALHKGTTNELAGLSSH